LYLHNFNNKAQVLIPDIIKNGYTTSHIFDDKNSISYQLNYIDKWDSNIYQFIKDVGLEDVIMKTIETCKNKIKEINSLIEQDEKNNQELLGF
jgi:hypothetical protein